MKKADYCLKSRTVFIGNQEVPVSGCVLVKGNRILEVVPIGKETEFLDENTKVLDAGDKLIMPGFIDAHTHFFSGAIAASSHVCGEIAESVSEEDCVRIVREYAAAHPEEKRIRGRGWFVTNWKDAPLPTKRSLDAVLPDIPVYLQAADCHSYWLNSRALEECGIHPDKKVESGYIGRFPDGELDGMLVEMEALEPADAMYRAFSEEELQEIYKDFLKIAARYGVTSMSEMMPDEYDIENYRKYKIIKKLEKEQDLSVRLHIFPKLYDCEDYTAALSLKEEFDSDYMRISGVKGFVDGVTETYTGLLLEPYEDRADTCGVGVPAKSGRELTEAVIKANRAGLPVRIHCIADGSVRMALDAFEESVKVNGTGLANTIEHIENVHPDDIKRFRQLGVLPSMQPIHLLLDGGGKITRLGKERCRYEWPLGTILKETGELAIGTDHPVVSMNPFENIYAAVTRNYLDGTPASVNPWERLTLGQALCACTGMAARAYSRQDIGILKAGCLADIVILDRNLFTVPEEEIPGCSVELTMSGGKIVYEKDK